MVSVLEKQENLGQISVENGVEKQVDFAANEDIYLPLTADEGNMIEKKINITDKLTAPVAAGAEVGSVQIFLRGELMRELPLYTVCEVPELTFWQKLKEKIGAWFG